MAEYCEYMWDPSRGHNSTALARSIYEEESRIEKRDKKLAIKTVRAILRGMPDVDLKHCTDEYITRFLLARKYRTEQAAALIAAYQAQIAHRQDIFGNLTARDPAIQRALRAGIPGVLPARDRKGRCVLVILASQWDPIAVPALSVQRAIFLVLEILIQDPRNQQSGFVAVVDWSGFSLRQGGALGAAALRNLIAALRGRFPARFKAIHFLSAPLYVQATLALVKPFLDEKTRSKIYLHGNNLSTLHEHLPTDILPAELGGTGPAFNPGLWAEPVIHSAMKEAELAAKRNKENQNSLEKSKISNAENERTTEMDYEESLRQNIANINDNSNKEKRFFGAFSNSRSQNCKKNGSMNVELNLINRTTANHNYDEEIKDGNDRISKCHENSTIKNGHEVSENGNEVEGNSNSGKATNEFREDDNAAFLDSENSTNFESTSSVSNENGNDKLLREKPLIRTGRSDNPSEKVNLIM